MTSSSPSSSPSLITARDELRAAVARARAAGRSIGLVPTMGALHAGHLSLVDASVAECGLTVVTIFVNPTQFGPGEDFEHYPRRLDADLAALRGRGVEVVFAPEAVTMYPPGHATRVEVDRLTAELEGRCRPGHFGGVATVVLKLFQLVLPDRAYFGQKDYQQYLVVRRMTEDLLLPVEIRPCPTIREPDGLAMSSRNAYLAADERRRAVGVIDSLRAAAALVAGGERDPQPIIRRMRERLQSAGLERIDYAALVDPVDLAPVREVRDTTLALVAAYAGRTRLIDNLLIGGDGTPQVPPTTPPAAS